MALDTPDFTGGAIPTTGQASPSQGGVPAFMMQRPPNPLAQFFGQNRVQPSAGGAGDMANSANHVQLMIAAGEKALQGMNKNDRNYAQLANILHKLARILPQGGSAPASGPLQTLLAQIQQAVRQRQLAFGGMQQAGGPAQQMAQATQPAMGLGTPPPSMPMPS